MQPNNRARRSEIAVLFNVFFRGGTSGFWGGQVVLVIHLSVGQVAFITKFEPCRRVLCCKMAEPHLMTT